MKRITLAAILALVAAPAQAQTPISVDNLSPVTTPLAGTEYTWIMQGGQPRRVTAAALLTTPGSLTITGGSINNTPIGGSTPSTGAFSILNVGTTTSPPAGTLALINQINSGSDTEGKVQNPSTASGTQARWTFATGTSNAFATIWQQDGASPFAEWQTGSGDVGGIVIDASAATGAGVSVKSNTGGVSWSTSGGLQAQVTNTATAVNNLALTGAATTAAPSVSATGSDTNVGLNLSGKGTGNVKLGTGTNTATVGVGGSALANGIVLYSQTITPAATSAAIQTAEQTFTVTGLSTSDTIVVNGPAPTSLCPMVGARVSALNTLQLDFAVLTAAACTPVAGTYKIVATR